MTTSPLPWSTRPSLSGIGAEVIDASGNSIAFFIDHRNADEVLEYIKKATKYGKLVTQQVDLINELKDIISDHEAQLKELDA